MKNTQKIVSLATLILAIGMFFAGMLIVTGRVSDFQQFILDRRQAAGQTGPDPAATCQYQEQETKLLITRKSRAKISEHSLDISGPFTAFFGGQNAAAAGSQNLLIYNCANDELQRRDLKERGRKVADIIFSSNGKNMALWGEQKNPQKQYFLEVFSFALDPGMSVWNRGFGSVDRELVDQKNNPNNSQPTGFLSAEPIKNVLLKGESLFWITQKNDEVSLFTYNYRKSHRDLPFNAWDPDKHLPFVVAGQFSKANYDNLGKKIALTLTGQGGATNYVYDFTCRLADRVERNTDKTDTAKSQKSKPCRWQKIAVDK